MHAAVSSPLPQHPPVLTAVHNHTGLITLNRPEALNALSLQMVQSIHETLIKWRDNSDIHRVLIDSADERAFCAGGDIRSVYNAKQSGDYTLTESLFGLEYKLNYLIYSYPKPYISLVRGICMGGGMGISIHGSHRIVTQNTVMAMPETTIGFFPDVGAGLFLNKCPGKIGLWMGLLGERLSAADALYAGLATHFISSHNLPSVRSQILESSQSVDDILGAFNDAAPCSKLSFLQEKIDSLFSGETVEDIFYNLRGSPHEEASIWLENLNSKSPTSLKLSFESLKRSKGKGAIDVFKQEYTLSQYCTQKKDFYEGIRALLIEKDQKPFWLPQTLDGVTEQDIENYFTSFRGNEWTPE